MSHGGTLGCIRPGRSASHSIQTRSCTHRAQRKRHGSSRPPNRRAWRTWSLRSPHRRCRNWVRCIFHGRRARRRCSNRIPVPCTQLRRCRYRGLCRCREIRSRSPDRWVCCTSGQSSLHHRHSRPRVHRHRVHSTRCTRRRCTRDLTKSASCRCSGPCCRRFHDQQHRPANTRR